MASEMSQYLQLPSKTFVGIKIEPGSTDIPPVDIKSELLPVDTSPVAEFRNPAGVLHEWIEVKTESQTKASQNCIKIEPETEYDNVETENEVPCGSPHPLHTVSVKDEDSSSDDDIPLNSLRAGNPVKAELQEEPSTSKTDGSDMGIVYHEIEPSTSKTALGSTMSYEIDANMERELIEPDDSDSEIEVDETDNDLMDIVLRTRNVFEYPAVIEDLDDPILSEEVLNLGAEDDVGLRALADPDGDLLYFDWRGDVNNFDGVRELFTGPSGPTFEVKGLTPLDIFRKIWDADIIDHIVHETNRYAHQMQIKTATKANSRMSRWKDTSADEIWKFLSIIMLQSLVVNDVEREYWYPKIDQLRIGCFDKIIPYNRFVLLKKCLHFVDNNAVPEQKSKLHKVMPIIEHINKKFGSLYLPEQNVAIDESLLLWKGRLSFAQLIATKRAKVGIKSYELCESRTGYLWRMDVYPGKGHVYIPQEAMAGNEPDSATSQIVINLMRPLFGRGHTLVMDNFYNAPLLSRILKKKYKTDSMGTLRLNREFVPETLKMKNKANMRPGEVCFSSTKDLNVVVWKDKNVVAMLSSFHPTEVGGKEKHGSYKYKPKVVLDYNLSMGGVDHKDQMIHAFPVERVRNVCWYKKLFRRLLNVSIHNCFVIFNTHDHTELKQTDNRNFRIQLVTEMLQMYSPDAVSIKPKPVQLSQMHLPAKNCKAQRCRLCAEAKIRRTTVWRCSTCNVNLCIEGCYTSYHAKYVSNSCVNS